MTDEWNDTYTWEELANPKVVRALLTKKDIRARKYLGQNFLIDANIIRKIVDAARPGTADLVVEIGPGLGCLTLALAEKSREVFALEKDPRLIKLLKELLRGKDNITCAKGDALTFELQQAWSGSGPDSRIIMVSNLPYRIAQTLMIHFLEAYPRIEEYVLMVQKEVGGRLLAGPGSREYGITTVKVRYRAQVSNLGVVSRNCFFPRPRVDSLLLKITRVEKPSPLLTNPGLFSRVIDGAFGQRRKLLTNALSTAVGLEIERSEVEHALSRLGISLLARAEDLAPEEFARLANDLSGKET